jgi:hypothetical protein
MMEEHGLDNVAEGRGMLWALVNMVLNLWVPSNVSNSVTRQGSSSFTRRSLFHGISY